MLAISKKRQASKKHVIVGIIATVLLGGGLYILSLVSAPTIAPVIAMKPIDIKTLPAPKPDDNRIVIPKIGVNIEFGTGEAALDRGAEWRAPANGNPADGGNFVIAAHRFSIQPTPQATVEKSPFYHIDRLEVGDKIVVDYLGKRYGYEVNQKMTVQPTQVEIENRTQDDRLTLYSCGLEGAESDRLVVIAKKLGEVAL